MYNNEYNRKNVLLNRGTLIKFQTLFIEKKNISNCLTEPAIQYTGRVAMKKIAYIIKFCCIDSKTIALGIHSRDGLI